MIEVKNLSRLYDDFKAVDDVSFSVGQREVIGLLGHNGAGKTTIMKMITGFLEPTSGSIQVNGLDVVNHSRNVQRQIGYLPENCPVWPEMNVIDYLEFQAALHQVPEEKRAAAIARAIKRTALQQKATMPIHTLSRGYRQRVGVAQALLHEPEIFILDEPTNGLDPTQILQMRELIAELAKTATVIISTHILQEVQAVCERVLIMRAGRMVVDSRLDALQQSNSLLLTVEGDPRQALRQALPALKSIQPQGSEGALQRYRITTTPDAAPTIASAVTTAGLRLHALQAERRDLEALFAEVNNTAAQSPANNSPKEPSHA